MTKNKKTNDVAIYQVASGEIAFRGDFKRNTIWGNLNQIAGLFDRDKSVIPRHLRNIFRSQELEPDSVVAKIATTATDGKTRQSEATRHINKIFKDDKSAVKALCKKCTLLTRTNQSTCILWISFCF